MKLFWEALKGLGVTLRHLVVNLWKFTLHYIGLSKDKGVVTLEYPEERRETFPRVRLRHRLLKRDDGRVRCVACFLCATACPAQCIYIEAEEDPDHPLEKRPKEFIIDIGRCAYCGFCVEACPEDALRMDIHIPELAELSRDKLIYTLHDLIKE